MYLKTNSMKVAIIGHGFVGKAIDFGILPEVERLLIDPIYNTKIIDLEEFLPEFIFICVPTPMNNDGSQNIELIKKIIEDISELNLKSIIVIKSTVLPNFLVDFQSQLPKIIYNPEFLRESNANEDFINSELIIFGGEIQYTNSLENFYKDFTICKSHSYTHTDIVTAAFIKYTINSFLASKVIFFNELFHLYNKSGAKDSWKNFITVINHDSRIGSSHMQVPGPDGRFGYGGACFPKDSTAFYEFSKTMQHSMELLGKSIEINNSIRSQYSENSKREEDQNINFNQKDLD